MGYLEWETAVSAAAAGGAGWDTLLCGPKGGSRLELSPLRKRGERYRLSGLALTRFH